MISTKKPEPEQEHKPDLRIAHISTVRFPSAETDTEQAARTIDALWNEGARIDMIVPKTQRLQQDTPEAAFRKFYNIACGFRVHTYPSVPALPLEADRIISAAIAGIKYRNQYDIIHTRSRGVVILSVLLQQPVIFETYRDLQKTAPVFSRLLKLLSSSSYFLGAICHSKLSANALKAAGIEPDKVAVVYNGFDPSLLQPVLSTKTARTMVGLPHHQNLVVYAGNVQHTKGISILLDLAKDLPDVQFMIVGGQPRHLKTLKAEISARNIGNIKLAGWKNHIELGPYLYAADILIIPPTSGPLEKFGRTVLPMKTFLFLGVGRTILAPATADISEILEHDVDALLTPPDDRKAAAAAIRLTLSDTSLSNRLAKNALKKSRDFSWRKRARKIRQLYQNWLERVYDHAD